MSGGDEDGGFQGGEEKVANGEGGVRVYLLDDLNFMDGPGPFAHLFAHIHGP